jgi:hypothetical protein
MVCHGWRIDFGSSLAKALARLAAPVLNHFGAVLGGTGGQEDRLQRLGRGKAAFGACLPGKGEMDFLEAIGKFFTPDERQAARHP